MHDFISYDCDSPPWGLSPCPWGHDFNNSGRGLQQLHYHAFTVFFFSTFMVIEKNFENLGFFACLALPMTVLRRRVMNFTIKTSLAKERIHSKNAFNWLCCF